MEIQLVVLAIYIIGYFIAVGYQYMAIEYYNPGHGVLNKVCGSIILGTLSWVLIGVVVHKIYNDENSFKKNTKEE